MIEDVEANAIQNLNEKYAAIVKLGHPLIIQPIIWFRVIQGLFQCSNPTTWRERRIGGDLEARAHDTRARVLTHPTTNTDGNRLGKISALFWDISIGVAQASIVIV